MMLAAMLAMVLVAAAPAFAQATGGDVDIQVVDCSQVAAVAAAQGQYGDATATSGDVASAAAAEIANELGVSVEQVNACVEGVAAGDDIVVEDDMDHEDDAEAEASAEASASAGSSSGGSSSGGSSSGSAASSGTLPDTGGASLITLGAGALLVAGGLVARRIVR